MVAVSRSAVHGFAKVNQDVVRLAAGVGVEGDVHSGTPVQHRSRRGPNPPPNLRQVHLPVGTWLHLGEAAVVELTGLRNRCTQIDGHQDGLMRAVLDRDADGNLVRKAGVMGVVLVSGLVRPADVIGVELPAGPHTPLAPV